jgi:hypothetical protein
MKLPDEIREYFKRQGATGGKTRAKNLTDEERRKSAKKAAQARWSKAKSAEKKTTRPGGSK